MTMLLDIFEPEQVEQLVGQSIPVSRTTLNLHGYADYMWRAVDGHTVQVERKQIDEVLGGIDRVEEQLRREMVSAEETILIYEGTFEPIAGIKTACQSFRKARDGRVMVPGHKYHTSYTGVMAWLSQLDKAGITIIHTIDYVATAFTLVALYQNSQKEEHTTLRRYIKQKIYPKPYNPYVETLMGIAEAKMGSDIATAIIDRYGTPWYAFQQSAEDLGETLIGGEGEKIAKRLGTNRAKRILKSIGKEV